MKKTILILILSASLFSCKKNYNCSCIFFSVSSTTKYEKMKKQDAQAKCDENLKGLKQVDANATCELK